MMGAVAGLNAGYRGLTYTVVVLLSLITAILLLSLASPAAPGTTQPAEPSADAELTASDSYGELPLAFEPNAGRYSPGLDFVASSKSGSLALSDRGASLTQTGSKRNPGESIQMSLPGASLTQPLALAELPGVVNDLRGDDPSAWTTEIPTFERIRYAEAYPGIDLDYHGTDGALEYDFRLAPGADPTQISLAFPGADSLRIAPSGDLVIAEGDASFRQQAPVSYQPGSGGPRSPVSSAFTLNHGRVGFELGAYDRARRLVIDPLVLAYSTYLGGGGADYANSIAVDSSGSAYISGFTHSTDFDTTVNSIGADSIGNADAFVSKLNPTGSALIYSTYLGGGGFDNARSVAVDSFGSAYVSGYTDSNNFTTVNPIAGEGDPPGADAFISKLNPAGSELIYSTYLGGDGSDDAKSVAVDSTGSAYISGITYSADFNTTVNSIGADSIGNADAFVSKLNPTGSALTYSTYLGGNGLDQANSVAVDSFGSAYVSGYTDSTNFTTVGQIEGDSPFSDAFVSKLNPAGSALAYSTYLGGAAADYANAIAVDSSGSAYISGNTESSDFDTVNPIEADSPFGDAFVSKLDPAGSALTYSTYLGGDSFDEANSIAVDSSGSAYISGYTESSDFDTVNPIEADSPFSDAFVSKLDPAGSALTYSTYLGGDSDDFAISIAIDSSGSAYISGFTYSTDFDTVNPIEGATLGSDTFVSKLDTTPETTIDSGPAEGSTSNDPTPTFSFSSSEPASTFECRIDAGTFGACSSPDTRPVLLDGPHSFEVRAIDNGSNPDPTPASRSFSVDTVVPPPPDSPPPDPDPALPAPVQGEAVNAVPVSGEVFVKLPGTNAFVRLEDAEQLPTGTIFDLRNGRINLISSAEGDTTRSALFYAGLVKVLQAEKDGAETVVKLVGPLEGCGKKRGEGPIKRQSRAAAIKGRGVWGKGGGGHKSSGKKSSGSVRGTWWLVEDLCSGETRTFVKDGVVSVRDFERRRTVKLRKGEEYLAPGPKRLSD